MAGENRPEDVAATRRLPRHAYDPFGALPAGSEIGKYEVVETLGQGGFGITYLARDTQLRRAVAIKEYLPTSFAMRQESGTVMPRTTQTAADFLWGRDRFLDEARTLAALEDAPGIVNVHDFLEANGTAYMVMALVRGETVEARLKRSGRLPAPEVDRLLRPLLDGLELVHAAGFLHRDIKPANILIDTHGRPTLIDFGASRAALQGRTQVLTAVYTPGYAAFEQSTSAKQGPWTDIYGLAATLYHCVSGAPPPSASDRMIEDRMVPAVQAGEGRYAEPLLAAIDAGLRLKPSERPQTIGDWRQVLADEAGGARDGGATRRIATPARPVAPGGNRRWMALGGGVLAIAAGGALWLALQPSPKGTGEATRKASEIAGSTQTQPQPTPPVGETEADRRKSEADAARTAAAERAAAAEANRRKAEQDAAAEVERRRLEEQARAEAEAEARRKAEEEAARKAAAERTAADDARRKAEQDAAEAERRRVEEQARAAVEARRKADEEAARKAAAERAAAEDVRRKAEQAAAEAERRRVEDRARAEAEARRKADEETARKAAAERAAAEDARRKAEQEAAAAAERRRLEAQARAEAEARRKAEAEAVRQADAERAAADEARRQAAAEAARRAEAERAEVEAARRRIEELAAADAEIRRLEEQARAAAAAQRKIDEETARRAEAERAAAEEARRAEDAERRRVEQHARAEAEARRQAEAEAARRAEAERAAAADARRKAEQDGAAAEADARRKAEAAEAALRLSEADRRRVQVALTALGFDTQGQDGVLGPRSRRMIVAWQKRRGAPETGYLTAAQLAALVQQAGPAIARFEDDARRQEEDKRRAQDEAKRKADEEARLRQEEEARRRAQPSPTPPQTAAAPGTPAPSAGSPDGRWTGSLDCGRAAVGTQAVTITIGNGAGRTHSGMAYGLRVTVRGERVSADLMAVESSPATLHGSFSGNSITAQGQLRERAVASYTCTLRLQRQ